MTNPKTPEKERAEKELIIRMILEMRFGDGSGQPNLQINLATKEILSQLDLAYKQGYKASQKHLFERQYKKQLTLRKKRIRTGLCYVCGKPAVSCYPYFVELENGEKIEVKTKAHCQKHLDMAKKQQKRFREKRSKQVDILSTLTYKKGGEMKRIEGMDLEKRLIIKVRAVILRNIMELAQKYHLGEYPIKGSKKNYA